MQHLIRHALVPALLALSFLSFLSPVLAQPRGGSIHHNQVLFNNNAAHASNRTAVTSRTSSGASAYTSSNSSGGGATITIEQPVASAYSGPTNGAICSVGTSGGVQFRPFGLSLNANQDNEWCQVKEEAEYFCSMAQRIDPDVNAWFQDECVAKSYELAHYRDVPSDNVLSLPTLLSPASSTATDGRRTMCNNPGTGLEVPCYVND